MLRFADKGKLPKGHFGTAHYYVPLASGIGTGLFIYPRVNDQNTLVILWHDLARLKTESSIKVKGLFFKI